MTISQDCLGLSLAGWLAFGPGQSRAPRPAPRPSLLQLNIAEPRAKRMHSLHSSPPPARITLAPLPALPEALDRNGFACYKSEGKHIRPELHRQSKHLTGAAPSGVEHAQASWFDERGRDQQTEAGGKRKTGQF